MRVLGRAVVVLGVFALFAALGSAQCVSLTTSGATYTQDFNTLASSGTSSTLPTGWFISESGTNANTTYTAGTGSSNTGDTYSFGSAAVPGDRALGGLRSGSLVPLFGACFTNNTGSPITSLAVAYNGEQWRLGTTARTDQINFEYSTNATSLTTGAWNGVSALNFVSPDTGTVGAKDGNTVRTALSSTISSLSIANGATFWIRWTDIDATNADDGLAVDDFNLTPTAGPSNPSGVGLANPSSVVAGGTTLLTVAVTLGGNPTSTGLAVNADLSAIGGSATQQFFDDGTHGDVTSGDNTFSFSATVNGATTAGGKSLPFSISDAQARSGSGSIALTVTPLSTPPSGTGAANPNSLLAGASTVLTVTVTPGANPASTGITVTVDLTAIGGSATQQFADNGVAPDVTAGDGIFSFQATVNALTSPGLKSLPVSVADAQARTGNTSISLTVQSPPAPTSVKISQVYGGGGNSGSTYKNDFIELFNQSNTAVDISTWSVQQQSATNTGTWNVTNLCAPSSTCTIQPGHYFLVQESAGTGGTTSLPTADATGAFTMGAGSGKIALLNTTVALSGACPIGGSVADVVGYGSTANCFEASPTGGPDDNVTAVLRKGNGCTDTNNNSSDFVLIGPLPRNSASPAQTCGGDPTQLSGLGTATPSSVDPGGNTLLKIQVTPATSPASTGITVTADLTSIGGPASQQFFDDGSNGDTAAGDNTFSFRSEVGVLPTGAKNIVATVTDLQGRSVQLPITITIQSPTCGVERWSVKTGTDPDAGLVNLTPVRTSIKAMRAITAPADPPGPPLNARVQPTETTTFLINALLTVYKLEDDVDYHIVIQDPDGNTMITEIPSPACDGSTSPFDAAVAAVRAKFDAKFTAIKSFQLANVPVQMKGVGFFDFIHGQTGVAPNGVELHPVLDVIFTTQSTTVLTSDINPSTFGQAITLTATVTAPAIVPTGTVTFYDGTTSLGTGSLNGSGVATLTTSGLPAGVRSLKASYEGDSQASESTGTLSQTVNPAPPVLSWAHPADITVGAALGAAQLNATANVPGAFAYNPPAGTILPVGNNQPLNATFTPTSSNYASGPVATTINVLPSSVVPSQPNVVVTRSLARVGGQVVATLTLTNSGGVDAQNVVLSTAKIGTTLGTPLPQSLGTIPAGTSVPTTVTFPGSVGASGAASSMTVTGSYTGGTFSSSARITLP